MCSWPITSASEGAVDRRAFLSAAGGAILAPLGACTKQHKLECGPQHWVTNPPMLGCEQTYYGCPQDLTGAVQILDIPPAQQVPDFDPGPCRRPVPRLLWSELKLSKTETFYGKLTDDLRQAYDILLCRENHGSYKLLVWPVCTTSIAAAGGQAVTSTGHGISSHGIAPSYSFTNAF